MNGAPEPQGWPTVVTLAGDAGDLADQRAAAALTQVLAECLAETHGDAILFLSVLPSGSPPIAPVTKGSLSRRWIEAAPGEGTRAEIVRAIVEHGAGAAYVFVDLSAFAPGAWAELGSALTLLVWLTRDALGEVPHRPGLRVLRTVFLGPEPLPAPTGFLSALLAQLRIDADRTLGRATGEHPEVVTDLDRTPSVRVRLPVDRIATMSPPSFGALAAPAKESALRWARAITGRRVGLAFGGSGAWGFASVALAREVKKAGIPVDLVGGVSSGSVMAAYYCVRGEEGLDLVVDRGGKLFLTLFAAMIWSGAIELTVNQDLGWALVDELEVPFVAVATNLTTNGTEVMGGGHVGYGVRASSAAPGLFPSMYTDTGVYADGRVTDNVPVDAVRALGADLVIASNPLPPPLPLPAWLVSSSAVMRAIHQWSPIGRLVAVFQSFELESSTAGRYAGEDALLYEPPPKLLPALRSFHFWNARTRVAEAAADPLLAAVVSQATAAWRAISAPRIGPAVIVPPADPAPARGASR